MFNNETNTPSVPEGERSLTKSLRFANGENFQTHIWGFIKTCSKHGMTIGWKPHKKILLSHRDKSYPRTFGASNINQPPFPPKKKQWLLSCRLTWNANKHPLPKKNLLLGHPLFVGGVLQSAQRACSSIFATFSAHACAQRAASSNRAGSLAANCTTKGWSSSATCGRLFSEVLHICPQGDSTGFPQGKSPETCFCGSARK